MLIEEFTDLQKRTVTALKKKKIYTADDMAGFVPRDYHDYRTITPLSQCKDGDFVAVKGRISRVNKKFGSRYYTIIRIEEEYPRYLNLMYFAQADYYAKIFGEHIMQEVVVCGKIKVENMYGKVLYSISPAEDFFFNGQFRPFISCVYPNIKGVSDEMRDKLIHRSMDTVEEPLAWEIMSKHGLMDYRSALSTLHRPTNPEQIQKARERLLFNDLLYFSILFHVGEESDDLTTEIRFDRVSLTQKFMQSLPFKLTADQLNVLNRMVTASRRSERNNVLLQGDVGCGKTIVAAVMMITAYENGFQSVLMAPKEILARQHYEEIAGYAKSLGIGVCFLHSGMKAAERKEIYNQIKSGEISFIIGTHSCLSDQVDYAKLGLIVIDEEHLFGVEQKEKLEEKAVNGVHCLSMSATPVPRSLATVMYGNKKEILQIKTKPAGRLPIQTAVQMTHKNTFPFMEKQIGEGHQCYVVCPAIEDNSAEDRPDIVSIEAMYEEYRSYFEPRGIKIGVVHGKMKKEEIAEVVHGFSENRVQILMSTTVIEVGVNVPNATVMVIEQADRFGLASLHQLRGRVGRSSLQSYCILRSSDPQNERLQVMVKTTDGFEIAEADLQQRGTGNLIGVAQSGANKYVEEMLDHPDIFRWASSVAGDCYRHQYAVRLINKYEEHEALCEQNKARAKVKEKEK